MNNKMIFCKNFIKKYFIPVGITREYKIRNYIRKPSPCSKKVTGLLRGIKYGFFVELGANDGVSQSNTLFLERKLGWKGVLIEPSLNNFMECKNHRSKRNYFECCACVPLGYEDEFVKLSYSHLMTIGDTSHISHKEHMRNGNKHCSDHFNNDQPIEFCAKAMALNDVFIKAKAPTLIDLLSLDVEGAELGVLEGIDFSRYKFKYMVIECRDLQLQDIENYLKSFGYIMLEKITHHDYVFMHSDFLK